MPTARITSATGPIDLYYEETGEGFPLIWCHEFGGDYRAWEPLMTRGVMMKRKTIFELEAELATIPVPALIVVGDQDEPCLEPGLFMKRLIPHAGLLMLPMTGHASNIEEPGLFNQHVAEFLAAVESGRWGTWQREASRARAAS